MTRSVHGRVARRWVPAFETAPSDNLSPLDRPLATEMRMRLQSGPRGPSPCGRVPFGRGAGSGAFSRSRERGHSPSSSSFPVSRCGRREPRLRKRSERGT